MNKKPVNALCVCVCVCVLEGGDAQLHNMVRVFTTVLQERKEKKIEV